MTSAELLPYSLLKCSSTFMSTIVLLWLGVEQRAASVSALNRESPYGPQVYTRSSGNFVVALASFKHLPEPGQILSDQLPGLPPAFAARTRWPQ